VTALRWPPLALAGLFLLAAVFAPVVAPYDPDEHLVPTSGRHAPPSLAHPLGTDLFNRDVLSRLLHGARISLAVAALSALVAAIVGTGVGLLAGFAGGLVDGAVMRTVDALLAIPRVFFVLMVVALWQDAGLTALVLILGLTGWFATSRLVRAGVLSARAREYVVAAEALGLTGWRIALRHVLPNVTAPIIVSVTLGVGQIILLEAALSFFGVGVRPPQPSLGNMIADGKDFLFATPLVSLAPGLVIVGAVLACSALGERLRQALDPRTT
jgi:peptide/nickel transport system permease protein